MSLPIRICLPCPRPKRDRTWGDWYFATSLARSLNRAGRTVRLETRPETFRPSARALPWRQEIDIVLRGKVAYGRRGRCPLVIWVISQADTLTEQEIGEAEHIFAASQPLAEALAARGARGVSVLPQCTDPEIFSPERRQAGLETNVLFVGNRREEFPRRVVDLALATGCDLAVWGRGWEDRLPDGVLRGRHIENAALGAHYASARVVLNDHHPGMLDHGLVSNRVYDVLASGSAVVTERMAGMPEDIAGCVNAYGTGDFEAALHAALDTDPAARRSVADHVRAVHGFDNRAKEILKVLGA
ncbi:hypothetical protein [Pseudooceanicola sp. LIPI14-2-Ac024]|uniref:glycosyltransferase family protein n=1 Tax=Pseudooceanicola sp. LIPI14-2-Ac024 TaxID=3344875 RepID=UPI0035CF0559